MLGLLIADRLGEETTAQDGAQVPGHDGLLLYTAVILQGQDQRVR